MNVAEKEKIKLYRGVRTGQIPTLGRGDTGIGICLKNLIKTSGFSHTVNHRRRIEREAMAKVVASVWGTECI